MLDKNDWIWGYERLGDWFPMRIFLALVFVVIALATLHFVFAAYHKILQNPQLYMPKRAVSMIFNHILFWGL